MQCPFCVFVAGPLTVWCGKEACNRSTSGLVDLHCVGVCHATLCCVVLWQAEEAAPADVQATLQTMHEWSSSIDTPQLLQAMAQADTAAVQQVHDKAQGLVQQLEQQLQQVSEPAVAASWFRASAYDTYAVLLRAADWLSGMTDLHAAQKLADLVRVSGCEWLRCVFVVKNCRACCACAVVLH